MNIGTYDIDFEGFEELRQLKRGNHEFDQMRREIIEDVTLFRSVLGVDHESLPLAIFIGDCTDPKSGVEYWMELSLSRKVAKLILRLKDNLKESSNSKEILLDKKTTIPLYAVVPIAVQIPFVKTFLEKNDEDAKLAFSQFRGILALLREIDAAQSEQPKLSFWKRITSWLQ